MDIFRRAIAPIPVVITILVVAGITVTPPAVDIVAGDAINPDHPLYSLERVGESIRLFLTLSPSDKVKFHLHLCKERLVEAVAVKNNVEMVKRLCDDYRSSLRSCMEECARIGDMELIELVANSTSYHKGILETLLEEVPPEAVSAIELSIEVSEHGHDAAKKALEGEIPIQEIEEAFRRRP
jgi:hypothetical protein